MFKDDFKGFSEDRDQPGYCSDAKLIDDIEKYNPHARFVMIPKNLHYYFYKHDGKVENMTDTKIAYRLKKEFDNPLERKWEF